MRYYAIPNENGEIIGFGIGFDGVEISESEYLTLKERTYRIWDTTDSLLTGEIAVESIDEDIREEVCRESVKRFAEQIYEGASFGSVPESLRDAVQVEVDKLIAERGPIEEREISDEEALSIILGGETA